VKPGDIVKSIATDAGIPGSDIGNIDVQDDATFVEVRSTVATKVLERAGIVSLRNGEAHLTLARQKSTESKAGASKGQRPKTYGSNGQRPKARKPKR
jgi:ATP-dependent RNA helicase DeaD